MPCNSNFRRLPAVALAALLPLVLAGCSSVEPFVFDPTQFNRNAEGFGRKPADIDGVDICYSRYATTPDAVTSLAAERCGEYGKRAVFYGQDVLQCPLLAPMRARYRCVAP